VADEAEATPVPAPADDDVEFVIERPADEEVSAPDSEQLELFK